MLNGNKLTLDTINLIRLIHLLMTHFGNLLFIANKPNSFAKFLKS